MKNLLQFPVFYFINLKFEVYLKYKSKKYTECYND